jgi:hypothetical protein
MVAAKQLLNKAVRLAHVVTDQRVLQFFHPNERCSTFRTRQFTEEQIEDGTEKVSM